jgi:hypothetical protein
MVRAHADSTDRAGLGFGDDEHADRMGVRTEGGKLTAASSP